MQLEALSNYVPYHIFTPKLDTRGKGPMGEGKNTSSCSENVNSFQWPSGAFHFWYVVKQFISDCSPSELAITFKYTWLSNTYWLTWYASLIVAARDIMDKSPSLTLYVIGPVVSHVMTRYAAVSAADSGAPAISSAALRAAVESFRRWAAAITALEGRLSSC